MEGISLQWVYQSSYGKKENRKPGDYVQKLCQAVQQNGPVSAPKTFLWKVWLVQSRTRSKKGNFIK